MSVNITTQANVAFKNLLGKSLTDAITKGLGNEAIPYSFNVHASTIFTDTISSTPSIAVTAGTAVFVNANLVLDGTSNGHAYIAQWPVSAPSGTDVKTSNPFAYGVGSLVGISAGDRIQNIISYQYGDPYEAKPFDNTVSPIPVADPRDWVFQYQSGIFFQQQVTGNSPASIHIYVYIGTLLSNFISGGGPWETLIASPNDDAHLTVLGDVLPNTNNSNSFGNAIDRWKSIYLSNTLDLSGTFKYVNGTQGVGKVLTSDGFGNATWTTISSSVPITLNYIPKGTGTNIIDGEWAFSGNDIYPLVNGSNIGLNGSPEHRINTIYMSSNIDFVDHLLFNELGVEKGRFQNGFFGLGTSSPTTTLHVVGTLTFIDGNQSFGKVLTSDANGVATWQTHPSGTITGSGTTNFIPLWTPNGTTLGNSFLSQNGNDIRVGSGKDFSSFDNNTNPIKLTFGTPGSEMFRATATDVFANPFAQIYMDGILSQQVLLQVGTNSNTNSTIKAAIGTATIISPLTTISHNTHTTNQVQISSTGVIINADNTSTVFINNNGSQTQVLNIGNFATSQVNLTGLLKYVDGNQGTNKILTSDSLGNATWQTPAAFTGTGIKYHIVSSDVITVQDNYQYLVYGDLTIDGILNNYGQVVVLNGAIIENGTFNNYGTVLLVQLATGTNNKYKATFTATANVPFTIVHNLDTLDFVYTVREGNNDASIQLTRIDVNTIQVVSTVNMTGNITIVGY